MNKTNIKLKKVNPKAAVILGLGSSIVFSTITGIVVNQINKNEQKNNPAVLSENSIMITVDEVVQSGDCLYDFAKEYYNEEMASFYDSVEEYSNAIRIQNNIAKNEVDNLDVGKVISIPVIIDKDNENYRQMIVLESKIDELEKNAFWIDGYQVTPTDTLWNIASRSCSNPNDINEVMELIQEKNNLTGTNFTYGSTISIPNPLIAELENYLMDANESLKDSIKEIKTKQ